MLLKRMGTSTLWGSQMLTGDGAWKTKSLFQDTFSNSEGQQFCGRYANRRPLLRALLKLSIILLTTQGNSLSGYKTFRPKSEAVHKKK